MDTAKRPARGGGGRRAARIIGARLSGSAAPRPARIRPRMQRHKEPAPASPPPSSAHPRSGALCLDRAACPGPQSAAGGRPAGGPAPSHARSSPTSPGARPPTPLSRGRARLPRPSPLVRRRRRSPAGRPSRGLVFGAARAARARPVRPPPARLGSPPRTPERRSQPPARRHLGSL